MHVAFRIREYTVHTIYEVAYSVWIWFGFFLLHQMGKNIPTNPKYCTVYVFSAKNCPKCSTFPIISDIWIKCSVSFAPAYFQLIFLHWKSWTLCAAWRKWDIIEFGKMNTIRPTHSNIRKRKWIPLFDWIECWTLSQLNKYVCCGVSNEINAWYWWAQCVIIVSGTLSMVIFSSLWIYIFFENKFWLHFIIIHLKFSRIRSETCFMHSASFFFSFK